MSRSVPGPRSLYVIGGRQHERVTTEEEQRKFAHAVAVEVEVETGTIDERVVYTPAPEITSSGKLANNVFKAGTLEGDRLYVCTETEILVYRLPGFELVRQLSLPLFNDLHHVYPRDDGTLLVAVTGLDMVVEIDAEGQVSREWSALGDDPWERFDRSVDYRQRSTKPHRSHPNYVFEADGELWVTRFEQRDALCLTSERRIDIGVERPHDGVVRGDRVYFTTVDGQVAIADPRADRVERVVDLNQIVGGKYALGWCRGLLPIDEQRVVVGFSRLRSTRFRQNLRWITGRLGLRETLGNLPTRIVCFDLEAGTVEWEVALEDAGVNVLFSIHPTTGWGSD